MRQSILIALTVFLFCAEVSIGQVGWQFLSIPNGVRETAMGETGTSHYGGGSAIWWNPAHISTDRSEVWFHVVRWITEGRGSFGGTVIKAPWGGMGIYYFNHGMNGFEVRNRPGPSQGTFTMHQNVFAAGTAIDILPSLKFGVTHKFATDDIYGDTEALSLVFDTGISWSCENWAAGISLLNADIFDYNPEELPTRIQGGLSHSRGFDAMKLTTALEGIHESGIRDKQYMHAGVEAAWNSRFFLRGGYMFGHDSRSLTAGLGATIDRYAADFALVPFDNGLGTTWRAGLNMKF